MTFAFHSYKPKNNDRRSGSFYDSIPSNLFQVIHKPSKDDILRQLKASTKNDKTAEWRMRSKYEGGCNREFDELRKQNVLFGRHSSRMEYSTNDYRSNDRGKGSTAYYDYEPIFRPGTANILDDNKNATIIREHCRRRGRLFGPQAIAAVCGYPTTKSIIRGRTPSPPLAKATTYYDDYDDTFSIASSKNSTFRKTHYNTLTKSSRSTDSKRLREELGILFSNAEPEPQSSSPSRYQQNQGFSGRNKFSVQHARSSDQANQKYSTPRNNVQVSHSDNISHKYDSSKVSARSEGAKKKLNLKSTRNATKFQLKNLDKQLQKLDEVVLGGGDPGVSESSKSRRGKMRMPKKLRNQSSKGKKPLRRKPNVIMIKRKSINVTDVLDDKRHRGPKIQGIVSSNSNTIESVDSQNIESIPPIKTIRTAVLPFPKAKYKRVMHD